MNSCRIHTLCHFGLSTHYFMSTVLTVSEPQIYVVDDSWHNGCRESAIVFSFMYNPALQFHCNFQFRHLWSSMDYLSWISTTPHLLELLWKWPCQLQIVFPTTPSYYFRRIFERQLTNKFSFERYFERYFCNFQSFLKGYAIGHKAKTILPVLLIMLQFLWYQTNISLPSLPTYSTANDQLCSC